MPNQRHKQHTNTPPSGHPVQIAPSITEYGNAEEFHPGAGIHPYLRVFADPLLPLIGAATEWSGPFDVLPAPPLYIPNPTAIVSGYDNPLGDINFGSLVEDT